MKNFIKYVLGFMLLCTASLAMAWPVIFNNKAPWINFNLVLYVWAGISIILTFFITLFFWMAGLNKLKSAIGAFIISVLAPGYFIFGTMGIGASSQKPTPQQIAEHEKIKRAYARFKELCDSNEGEVIYETRGNVDSIEIQHRPELANIDKQYLNLQSYSSYAELPYLSFDIDSRHDIYNKKTYFFKILSFTDYFLNNKTKKSERVCKGASTCLIDLPGTYSKLEEFDSFSKTWKVMTPYSNNNVYRKSNSGLENTFSENYRPTSKYILTYKQVTTPEETHDLWINGTKFIIKEKKSNKILATKTVYMLNPDFGHLGDHGPGWSDSFAANLVCPKFIWTGQDTLYRQDTRIWEEEARYRLAEWAMKVLKPKYIVNKQEN